MSHVVQWAQEQLAVLTVAGVEESLVVEEEGQLTCEPLQMLLDHEF